MSINEERIKYLEDRLAKLEASQEKDSAFLVLAAEKFKNIDARIEEIQGTSKEIKEAITGNGKAGLRQQVDLNTGFRMKIEKDFAKIKWLLFGLIVAAIGNPFLNHFMK